MSNRTTTFIGTPLDKPMQFIEHRLEEMALEYSGGSIDVEINEICEADPITGKIHPNTPPSYVVWRLYIPYKKRIVRYRFSTAKQVRDAVRIFVNFLVRIGRSFKISDHATELLYGMTLKPKAKNRKQRNNPHAQQKVDYNSLLKVINRRPSKVASPPNKE